MMEKEIEDLLSDREKFNAFIYTPLEEAIDELKKRKKDNALQTGIVRSIKEPIPIEISSKPHAVIAAHVATPNNEIIRFNSIIDAVDELQPLFCEYCSDKYTDNNESKYKLGKMVFYLGKGKKGGEKLEHLKVIDFNTYRGKKISDVKTIWNQSLVDFHHELFNKLYEGKKIAPTFFDISEWYRKCGGKPELYYEHLLKIFLSDAVLFANFLIDKNEKDFTKNIFLPAFIKVKKEFGYKPLIIALEPTEIEESSFWTNYPAHLLEYVRKKLDNIDK